MSKPKHTPGPWRMLPEEVDKAYIRIRGEVLGGRYKIANVLRPVHEGVMENDVQETQANAHLIAAAPDLLSALICITDQLERIGDLRTHKDGQFIDDARAAIAKATGAA